MIILDSSAKRRVPYGARAVDINPSIKKDMDPSFFAKLSCQVKGFMFS